MTDRKPPPSPWLKGVTGVTGVVPPGRRLEDEPRPTQWSASGVRGVVPPGKMPVGQAPGAHLNPEHARRRMAANQRALEQRRRGKAAAAAPERGRPGAGFWPDIFADITDPPDLQDFLKLLSDFLDASPPHEEAIDDIDHLIVQSRAPFDLVVGFTVMSTLVGKDESLRQEFAGALERGAAAFFNLALRLNPRLRIPRGVIPETVDALFFDLPDLALQVPFAFATDAFTRVMPLLRDQEQAYDAKLIRFALDLRERFIETRALGDQPLANLFPWALPEWTPPGFEEV